MLKQINYFYHENNQKITLPITDDFIHSTVNDDDLKNFDLGTQYIGFKIHDQELLLIMSVVKEIIMLSHVTFIPKSSPLIEGIIAVRGEIIPVVNLRRYLKFPKGDAKYTTRIIVMESEYGGVGLIVDDIVHFISLNLNDIESIPQNFFPPEYHLLSGVSKSSHKVIGILDASKIINEILKYAGAKNEA